MLFKNSRKLASFFAGMRGSAGGGFSFALFEDCIVLFSVESTCIESWLIGSCEMSPSIDASRSSSRKSAVLGCVVERLESAMARIDIGKRGRNFCVTT